MPREKTLRPGHEGSLALTDEELREIRACLDAGAPLPDKYRFRLFAPAPEPLLVWQGKTLERCRETRPLLAREWFNAGESGASEAAGTWRNLLVRGDNRLLLSSLLNGPLRRFVEACGGIKLMYIDPPFAVGADFAMPLELGTPGPLEVGRASGRRKNGEKAPRLLAYRDRWEQGLHSFLRMIHERLLLMRDLLAEDGSLYLHCDWRLAPHMRLVLDEIFGPERFLGDIVWHYTGGGRSERYFSRKHDRLLHYAASRRWIFNVDAVRVPYKPTSGYAKGGITSAAGKRYSPNPLGTPVDDVWDIPMINPLSGERLDYPTQKPEALLERIVKASSRPGDLVADFFCGSGTLPAVAEKLGRKWLAADSSPPAVHATRKRLLDLRAGLPLENPPQPFLLAGIAPEPAADGPASFDSVFFHQARLTRQTLPYSISDVRTATYIEGDRFSLELAGFSPAAPGRPGSGDTPEAPTKDAALFAALLRRDWRDWLDYWSIGAPDEFPTLSEGMEKDLHCNGILWHSARKRKGAGPETRSPFLPLPGRGQRSPALVLTIIDIFANESRLPVRLFSE